MRHFGLLALFIVSIAVAQTGIEKQIAASSQKLKGVQASFKSINERLKKTAQEIMQEKKRLDEIEAQIADLEGKISENEKEYNDLKEKIDRLNQSQKALVESKQKLNEKVAELMAKHLSMILVFDEEGLEDPQSVIEREIIKKICEVEKRNMAELEEEYRLLSQKIDIHKDQIDTLIRRLSVLDQKKDELIRVQNKKSKLVSLLEERKREYKKEIDNLQKEQDDLRQTLQKLEIFKQKQTKNGTENAKAKEGSSYQESKTVRYSGPKTIPPMEEFDIVKQYGPYVDPVYNLNIFNESITLAPREENAKVVNVLNGKVILAKETPHLNNVVIIEHDDGLHTIYANLDVIAPTVKPGAKIKKGYVIGRVTKKLTFEVTQQNSHINPLDLIMVK